MKETEVERYQKNISELKKENEELKKLCTKHIEENTKKEIEKEDASNSFYWIFFSHFSLKTTTK